MSRGAALRPADLRRTFVTVDDPRWRQAHGSTVLVTDGTAGREVLVAWFAGEREGAEDSSVWLARRDLDGGAWGEPERLLDGPPAHWNPVLAEGPEGDTWLFAKRGELISAWQTWVRRSADGGTSWGEPHPLVPGDVGGRGPVRNPPLLLDDGTWLAPSSTERWGEHPRWESSVDRSTDGGRTWTAAEVPLDRSRLRGAGAIQPALWASTADGVRAVHALLRSSEGRAYRSRSLDGGRTWSPAEPGPLPNGNAALAVVGLGDGRVVCAHNPADGDWAPRCPLVLSVSADDGATWRTAAVLDDGCTPVDDDPSRRPAQPAPDGFAPADGGVATDGTGEYSYPALALADGVLHATWTWQRRGIAHAAVPLDDLTWPDLLEDLP
ncbi:exo-alpha-sialidase [uncultured Pseudokineococcus sp.]|uniref:sialidase family protein n=1 Tax=uncultured Pseudokineococcus sp. TaxID=1642928 RepID=UPI0026020E9F|nr:sialidase family protein [uncultured Pseudokineococcus sp.]